MKTFLVLAAVQALAVVAIAAPVEYHVVAHYKIGGDAGGFDYLRVDPVARRLYVAHEKRVEVLDEDTGKKIGEVGPTTRAHGIAVVSGSNHGFATSGADAVTGLVLPARLDTVAQRFFQFDLQGFGHGCIPLVYDQRFFAETCPAGAQVWRIGAGANMAFRRAVFDRVGGFDERLGAGASGCSEDSELWYRLLAGGGSCCFEPRAVVQHHHREDWDGLRRQIRAYAKGHVSALFVQADRFGHRGNLHRMFIQMPAYYIKTAFQAVRDGDGRRGQILRDEIFGWLKGLTYGLRPVWRRQSKQAPHRAPAAAE